MEGVTGTFQTPTLEESDVPALWGMVSLEKHGAIIDCGNHRLFLPGTGGYKIGLSPGSRTIRLEKTVSGHLSVPVTDYPEHYRVSQCSESPLTLLSDQP